MDFTLLCENYKGEYVVLNDVRMAYIRLASLVYLTVYVCTYCVPIAHLRQNKQFSLLYLGHAQIMRSYELRYVSMASRTPTKVYGPKSFNSLCRTVLNSNNLFSCHI